MATAGSQQSGSFGFIGVFSAGARNPDDAFGKQLDAVKAGGVKFYWIGAGDTDFARALDALARALTRLLVAGRARATAGARAH